MISFGELKEGRELAVRLNGVEHKLAVTSEPFPSRIEFQKRDMFYKCTVATVHVQIDGGVERKAFGHEGRVYVSWDGRLCTVRGSL